MKKRLGILVLLTASLLAVAAAAAEGGGSPGLAGYGISIDGGFGRLTNSNHLTKTVIVRYDSPLLKSRCWPRPNLWGGYGLDAIDEGKAYNRKLTGNPFLAGLGLGFGTFSKENTSAFNIDIGAGYYEGVNWRDDPEIYVGVSMDFRLVEELLKALGRVKFE